MKDRTQGIISVTLADLGDAVQLEVSDDGSGLPPDFAPQRSTSLGLQIVHTLVTDDLKGTLRFESGSDTGDSGDANVTVTTLAGARAIVVFPKRPVHAG